VGRLDPCNNTASLFQVVEIDKPGYRLPSLPPPSPPLPPPSPVAPSCNYARRGFLRGMDTQLVDFESFFNQLLPLTEQDHRIMYGGQQSIFSNDTSHDTSSQFLDGNFSDVVVKQEQKGKGT
jgi:hypothetical protein